MPSNEAPAGASFWLNRQIARGRLLAPRSGLSEPSQPGRLARTVARGPGLALPAHVQFTQTVKIQLLRHATLLLEFAGKRCLVDPMLSPARAWDPVRNSANPQRNPMVELALSEAELDHTLAGLDALFVTHLHADHWDDPAKQMLVKHLPLFCQPNDEAQLKEDGFDDLRPVNPQLGWDGISISLTGGQHGTGELAERIGPVSGFVIEADGEPSLYIAGDTIWCAEVAAALEQHQPQVVVVNAGAAQFLDSDPITMTAEDVIAVASAAPEAKLIAVHMETINHCQLTRSALAEALEDAGLTELVWIPADTEARDYPSSSED